MMRTNDVIQTLQLHGNIEVLPSGYHSKVTLIVHNGRELVVKIIDKPEFCEPSVVEELMSDIRFYRDALEGIGVLVPRLESIQFLPNTSGIGGIIIITPFHGYDAERLVRNGQMASLTALEGILKTMEPFLRGINGNGCETVLGIDPKPANFVTTDFANYHFVDWMPPRFRKNGIPMVEFRPAGSEEGGQLAYFRSYDARGILLVLQSQMSRLDLKSRALIKERIRRFAASLSLRIAEHLEQLPSEGILDLPASRAGDAIAKLRPLDLYVIREIACEFCSFGDGLAHEGLVEEIFRLTHYFDDLPPPEQIEQAKSLLQRHQRHQIKQL